ncbi:hypothetical protein ABH931_006122 [Streptacidiphilus sp. MAP12-33]|uniref:hypothetical protein n=1 Tax=Streptacidiphilus sp. MAP12-33 TaxID=3156266 RepID=UPI003515F4C9
MTAQTIADLRRELEKARIVLIGAQTHLAHHAEANAALHCATTVLYSPLHAQVTAAIGQIEHALQRTEPDISTADPQPWVAAWALEELGGILLDLDRCQHGRHPADPCADCGGMSKGNPNLKPGQVIGYTVHGDQIVMPVPGMDRHDPRSWRGALAGTGGEQR